MSYIGIQTQNQISPQFSREVINGDGSATQFTLIQDVPGFNADNIMVVVNNVIQEPVAAYTIKEDASGNPRVLDFGAGNVLSTTDDCYVQHRGVGTLNMTPAAGSVNAAALQDNLRSGNVDSFTATAGQTAFTLTETPLNAQSISVFVNGIYQKPTTNFTVSGTTLTLTAGAVAGDEIDVIHHTIRTTVTHVADGSVTSGKLDTNIQVAGTLGVTGNVTASADLSVAGNLTVSGTTTTIDTTVTTSDAMVINNAGTDVGLKINSTSSGNILQLQDGGVDKVVVADGGNTTFSGNVLVDTIAEKTSANGVAIDGVTLKDGGGTFNRGTDGESVSLQKSASAVGTIGVSSDGPAFGTATQQIALHNGKLFPAQAYGSALDNTMDLGYSSSRFKDLYLSGNVVIGTAGKGIDFSAGSTSNGITGEVLEHIETGTYTPLCYNSAGATVGADSARGRYSVLGNVVFVEFLFQIANLEGAIGSATTFRMTLPVTSGNYAQTPRSFVDLYNSNGTSFYTAYLLFSGSQQPHIYLYHNVGATQDGTGTTEQYKGSDASTGTFLLRGNFYYFI